MASRILLQNGTLLVHEADGTVVARQADLRIEGNKIAEIGAKIAHSEGDKVIDCTSKIVSPGFISTHHHLWQTQLKGRHGNHNLLEYLPTGNAAGAFYTAEDAFWGELAGAMEAIDAGTTTVVDHASVNMSADHPPAMIQALATAGLRSVYCQTVPRALATEKPLLGIADDYSLERALKGWSELVAQDQQTPLANGRVKLGFAMDNLRLPPDHVQALYADLRAHKAHLITSHGVSGVPYGNGPSTLQLLDSNGLLGPDILVSHATHPKEGDAALLAQSGAFVSSTPNTELQMGATPIALDPAAEPHASLGVDCHSWGSSFMPVQMRMLLQHARTVDAQRLAADNKWRRHIRLSVQQVFNLATLGGARAVGMAGELGQLKLGARADLLVFDTSSTSMVAAAQENPVTAIVMHSSERDVDTVIVDGIVRKEGGKLVPVRVAEAVGKTKMGLENKTLEWSDVAGKLLESREKLNKQYVGMDWRQSEERLLEHMNRAGMIDDETKEM